MVVVLGDADHERPNGDEVRVEHEVGVDDVARCVAAVEAGAETAEREIGGFAVRFVDRAGTAEPAADDGGAQCVPRRTS